MRNVSEVIITESQVTILLEVEGRVCVVKMEEDELEAVEFVIKKAVKELIKTEVTQDELNKILLPYWFEEME